MATKRVKLKLSEELVQKCVDHAHRTAAHYENDGDALTAMPWTSDQMSTQEFAAWVESREEAARTIDPATCDLRSWHACDADPYGYDRSVGKLLPDMDQWSRWNFIRGPQSRGWLHEAELSKAQIKELYARIKREHRNRTTN
jgi:hypothetical protein